MDKLINFIKNNFAVFIIFAALILLRFIWIDKIPGGMQYDEVEYSLSGKTFQMMGADLSGTTFPESLISTNTLGRVSPVPYMILAPFWNFLDLNMITFRSMYVVLNSITAIVFMLLLQTLFKNKNISFLGGILFLLNPWSFFLSRHGMDGSFALLFYMLGTLFLLIDYSRKNILLSFIFYFLGAFSYHGAKLALIPLVTVVSVYKIYSKKITGKKLIPYGLIILALIGSIAAFVLGGMFFAESILETRTTDLVFTNTEEFSGDVNSIRTASIYSPLHNVMINKVMFAFRYFADNYFEAFSPSLLFLRAEVMEFHGFFYVFEAAFLILGFIMLFYKKRNLFWLVTAITIITPISTATSLSGFSIINRAIFLLPMLLIYITYGLYIFYIQAIKYVPQKIFIAALGIVYLGSFIIFQHTYFFILPIQMNGHYQTNTRVLAKYLSIESKLSPKIVIVAPKTQVLFSGLTFFLPRKEQEETLLRKQTFSENESFSIGNITLTTDCVTEINPEYTYIVDPEKVKCFDKLVPGYLIINQKDAAIEYSIVGAKTCDGYQLNRWRNPHLLSDFAIEKMDRQQFCERWIANTAITEEKEIITISTVKE